MAVIARFPHSMAIIARFPHSMTVIAGCKPRIRGIEIGQYLSLSMSVPCHVQYVVLTEDATTSSSRIFLKTLYQDLSELMGLIALNKRLQEPSLMPFFQGIFPSVRLGNTLKAVESFLEYVRLSLLAAPHWGIRHLSSPSSSLFLHVCLLKDAWLHAFPVLWRLLCR